MRRPLGSYGAADAHDRRHPLMPRIVRPRPVRAVSEVVIREAEFVPLSGGFGAVQPRKVEYAGVSGYGVAKGLAENAALFHGARSVVIELAGVEFANRPPVRTVVLEWGFPVAIQPDDPKPRPRPPGREGNASDDAGEVPAEFALNRQGANSVVIRTQLWVRQRVGVVLPCHASSIAYMTQRELGRSVMPLSARSFRHQRLGLDFALGDVRSAETAWQTPKARRQTMSPCFGLRNALNSYV